MVPSGSNGEDLAHSWSLFLVSLSLALKYRSSDEDISLKCCFQSSNIRGKKATTVIHNCSRELLIPATYVTNYAGAF